MGAKIPGSNLGHGAALYVVWLIGRALVSHSSGHGSNLDSTTLGK